MKSFPTKSLATASLAGLALLVAMPIYGQSPTVTTAPSTDAGIVTNSSAANAGMTTGLPGGASVTSQQMEMMQVRQAAQQAMQEAAMAQMSRSADNKIEDQHRDSALIEARENKRLKREAANRMKWERAHNAYNKVSADQMSTWRDGQGNVRVERNLPNDFLMALREEEAAMAAEAAERQRKEFRPLKAMGRAAGDAFFAVPMAIEARKESRADNAATQGGGIRNPQSMPTNAQPERGGVGGMLSKLKPKLPPLGGNNQKPANPYNASGTGAAAAPGNSAAVSEQSIQVSGPGRVPQISGAALVDGRSPTNTDASSYSYPQSGQSSSSGSAPQLKQANMSAAPPPDVPTFQEEKKGLFARMKSSNSRSSGGGGLSFGKKKQSSSNQPTIDGSLFPSGSVNQAPSSGAALGGGHTVASSGEMQSGYVGDVALPGRDAPEEKKRFSIPKPSLNLGGGGSQKPSGSASNSRSLSPFNASGNNYYVTANSAQFMKYGADRMESEITSLPAGVMVRMTRPGAEWAAVQLSDGTEGVIQVRNLRDASSSETSSFSGGGSGGGY